MRPALVGGQNAGRGAANPTGVSGVEEVGSVALLNYEIGADANGVGTTRWRRPIPPTSRAPRLTPRRIAPIFSLLRVQGGKESRNVRFRISGVAI